MKPTEITTYFNPSDEPITFRLGNTPGQPPEEYVIGPGEELKGPVNYESFYARKGLKKGNAPKIAPPPISAPPADPIDDIMNAGVPPAQGSGARPIPRQGLKR